MSNNDSQKYRIWIAGFCVFRLGAPLHSQQDAKASTSAQANSSSNPATASGSGRSGNYLGVHPAPGMVTFQLSVRASDMPRASVGSRIAPGDTPLNLLETPGGVLVSTNSPYSSPYLLAYDELHRRVLNKLELPALWYGLDYQVSRKLLLASAGTHSVWAVPFTKGAFGKPREIVLNTCDVTAGLVIDSDTTALVACNESRQIVRFDFMSGKVLATSKVGEYPYAVQKLSSNQFVVSNWGQASISILEGTGLKLVKTIPVGSHPTELRMLTRKGPLLVACSDSDLISIIDMPGLKEVRRVDVRVPGSPLGGAQLDALAIDPAGHRLFAALAAVNAVAVFDVKKDADDPEPNLHLDGLIPVGAYPSAILYSGHSQSALYRGRPQPDSGTKLSAKS